MKSDLVDIVGEVRLEKEKAYMFYDGNRTVWLPKALCEWDAVDKVMTMPEWIAKEKDLV